MAVAYRSSSNTGTSDSLGTSCAVPVPSGAAANDIALVGIEHYDGASLTITPPAGFTLLFTVTTSLVTLRVWWKRLSGGDTGSYTFTWSGSKWNLGHAVLLTGAKTSGDPIGTNYNTATGSGTSIPSTSVTVVFQPGLVHFVANENAATQTTVPTGFTEVQDGDYLHTNYRIPGTTGTHSASGGSLTTSTSIVAALIAVEPQAASGVSGSFAAVLPGLTGSLTADVDVAGTLTATLPMLAATATATVEVDTGFAGNLPSLAAGFTSTVEVDADLTGTLPALTGSFTANLGAPAVNGALDATLPALTAAASLTVEVAATLTASLPSLTASLSTVDFVGFTIGDDITGPATKPVPTIDGPALARTSTGPALARTVAGPARAEREVDGPAVAPKGEPDGPGLSRAVDGPALARTVDGPAL